MSGLGAVFSSAGVGAGNLVSWWVKRAERGANVLDLDLRGSVMESAPPSGVMQRFMPAPSFSMRELLSGLDFAAEDPTIKVLLLRIGDHDLGWGRATELCEAIKKFRAAGKYAFAFLESPENVDTLIAAACDRIATPPGVPVYLTGLLSEVMYFKGVLEKLEVKPELFSVGKYKSALEPYTRSGMSPAHREAVESLLDSIYGHWTTALARGRGLGVGRIKDLIDQGPWSSEGAKEAGLIDALLYYDQVDDYLEKWLGMAPRRIEFGRFLKVFGPRSTMGDPWGKQKGLALIVATGVIHGGESRSYGMGGGSVGADTLRRALASVREDDAINAVVLRVDSPGGSAAHSDLIWRDVERLAREKPVVASMGDVAASGGYYIAMPASHVMASPGTLTGSIGVVGGKMNLKGLYNKVGIKKEYVKRGAHSDISGDYGRLTPELRKKLKSEMETIYKIFVDKAAKARRQDYDQLHQSAQGRVWTGDQAKERGLIDEVGNLMDAINRAKERAGIPATERVPVYLLPRARKFAMPGLPFNLPIPGGSSGAFDALLKYEILTEYPHLALMPYQLKIK